MSNFMISVKQLRILEYLEYKSDLRTDFTPIEEIINYLKNKIKAIRNLKRSNLINNLIKSFAFLIRNNYIFLKNGQIKYFEKQSKVYIWKSIENNKIDVNKFNFKLLIENNWELKINPKIKPIIPIVREFYRRESSYHSIPIKKE